MTTSELTLEQIRKSPKVKGGVVRVSDFLTKEEKEENIKRKAKRKPKRAKFNKIDALSAEIIARFGYDFYKAWNSFELDEEWVNRLLYAERARERAQWVPIERLIKAMVGACIRLPKGARKPKGPKQAQEIINNDWKIARGEK